MGQILAVTDIMLWHIVPGSTLKRQNKNMQTHYVLAYCGTQDIYDLTMKPVSLIDSKFSPRDAVMLNICLELTFKWFNQ